MEEDIALERHFKRFERKKPISRKISVLRKHVKIMIMIMIIINFRLIYEYQIIVVYTLALQCVTP